MVHQGISIQFSSLQGRLSGVRLKKHAEELAKWRWRTRKIPNLSALMS
jgi:hypothetical protein